MSHLTYAEAFITGIVQGVSELFPVSSLGHNVLIPALIGGQWARDLNVTAEGSPYLAFVVALHVATALAMIAYFWRDWLRIASGFGTSIRDREVVTPDQRLAWMIIGGTIPVGLVGLLLQKVVTSVFAKPTLTALFLAVNGGILLYSERQRRLRPAGPDGGWEDGGWEDDRDWGGNRTQVWNQQPGQQQWQGPDPRYEQDPRHPRDRQGPSFTPSFTPSAPAPPTPPASPAPAPRFDPRGGQDQRDYGQDPRDQRYGAAPAGAAPQAPTFTPAGQPGRGPGAGQAPRSVPDERGEWGEWGPRGAGRGPGRDLDGRRDRYDANAGDENAAADQRLATMSFLQAVLVGAWQIAALLPGISRDGIVTVGGMRKGLRREDAVRYSFLLSAPVILAAGVLKMGDLTGPAANGIMGPVVLGSLLSFAGAYFSVRFLTRYFSESKSLKPFGIYCLAFGILSFLFLLVK